MRSLREEMLSERDGEETSPYPIEALGSPQLSYNSPLRRETLPSGSVLCLCRGTPTGSTLCLSGETPPFGFNSLLKRGNPATATVSPPQVFHLPPQVLHRHRNCLTTASTSPARLLRYSTLAVGTSPMSNCRKKLKATNRNTL